jgi:ABC-2 type transport system ATP-binding protein
VDNISVHIEKGEIVGFLGPNAAGKTTTMRILTGYLGPTQGNAWIGGYDVLNNSLEARQRIGYLPEAVPLYADMTVRSFLEFSAKLRGLGKSRIKRRTEDVVDICHLEDYIDVLIGKLSKGFRQRVGVAQAILHEPEVLILDEPTIGIDPIQVAMTRELIRKLGKEHTILISTHILPEVTVICERVIILHEGKIVAEDSISNLSSMIGGAKRLRLRVEGPAEKVTERLHRIDGIRRVHLQGPHHLIEYSEEHDPRAKIMEAVVQGGWTLLSLESVEMSLEDIFLKLTTKEERED